MALLIAWVITREPSKAALMASLVTLPLLSYGRIYEGLKGVEALDASLVRHRYLLPFLASVLGVGIVLLWRSRIDRRMNFVANSTAVFLLAVPLVTGLLYTIQQDIRPPSETLEDSSCTLSPEEPEELPDVYLIIMDAYERDDVLIEMHGYDNSWFLDRLKRHGFYVAHGSLSNYRFTVLSLPALLNMDYIQSFPDRYDPESNNRWAISRMIKDNRVRRELDCIGYKVIAIDSGVTWTDWPDAEYYFTIDSDPFHSLHVLGSVSRLEALYIETTVGRAYMDLLRQSESNRIPEALDPAVAHRERILFAFEQLNAAPALPSPKFVYAHIVSPHPPMVLGQGSPAEVNATFEEQFGGDPDEWAYLLTYSRQVDDLNSRILETVETILENSRHPPVIIIQADHGWTDRNPEDKLSILNAIHLPDTTDSRLYPTVTPVNTFRVVFDEYFGANLGLLEDRSYYSHLEAIYDFTEVENSYEEGEDQTAQ
jgi:hypothetical protein